MTLFKIPTSSTQTWYTQSVALSGQSFVLELRYNTRMGRWILNILDSAENPLLMGIPLLILRNLTAQYTALQLPDGALFCSDESGRNLQPTLASFLTDHTFWYADPTT